jgi:hypothetical protein
MKIDLGLVAEALESNGGTVWYLDQNTGNVFAVFEDLDEIQQESTDLIENDPDRFLTIDPLDSREGFLIMEDFIVTLPEGDARRSLQRAINGPKPFASFKHVLHDFQDERKAWFPFEKERMLEHAKEFLQSNEIDFE